jgi:hypothetical protein
VTAKRFEKLSNPPESPFFKGGKSFMIHRIPVKKSPPFGKGRTGGISGKAFSKR